jgi:glycosyltransferase involved in cell wall biosynthesis
LIAGFLTELKRLGSIPAFVTLQGDDVFLNALPEADRLRCLQQIRENNRVVDGFIVHSQAFGDYMKEYFSIPSDKIHVTPLGLETADFRRPPFDSTPREQASSGTRTLGYLARLAPEKGLHELVDAFVALKQETEFADVKLRLAGWLSPENRDYADQQWERLRTAGLAASFEYLGVVNRQEKLDFLRSIDILSVPTTHEEPKGLFALESLAAGVPVVLPRKGALTDVVEASRGGLLFDPDDRQGYLEALKNLLRDAELRHTLGRAGREFVLSHRNEETMARETMALLSGLMK